MIETMDYISMLRRMIKAGARRVGRSDEHELKAFSDLRSYLDEQIALAVDQQLAQGKSWTDIGQSLGISKQAAFKRFTPYISKGSLTTHD